MAAVERRRADLLVVAHLRKGETCTDLAAGFGVGTTAVSRYITEVIEVLAALAPTLRKAVETAVRRAFVILDGTLLRIDRVGRGRAVLLRQVRMPRRDVQVLADPAGR